MHSIYIPNMVCMFGFIIQSTVYSMVGCNTMSIDLAILFVHSNFKNNFFGRVLFSMQNKQAIVIPHDLLPRYKATGLAPSNSHCQNQAAKRHLLHTNLFNHGQGT
jgi:hypothetical protein